MHDLNIFLAAPKTWENNNCWRMQIVLKPGELFFAGQILSNRRDFDDSSGEVMGAIPQNNYILP